MEASSSHILCTLKHSSLSHRCSISPMPSPLPFLSLASDLPKLSVVFAINAKLTVLVVEKHGEARLDFKPYHHWTLKAKKTKFVIMYGLTFFFAKFRPNNTYFVVLEIRVLFLMEDPNSLELNLDNNGIAATHLDRFHLVGKNLVDKILKKMVIIQIAKNSLSTIGSKIDGYRAEKTQSIRDEFSTGECIREKRYLNREL
ncbi:hypothetical protein LguiA_024990 [Lonicera macranthoides]